ncbi:hypothetical protein [Methylobacterium sp. CM6257]
MGRLERIVTVLVEAQLTAGAAAPPDLIGRLRRLERSVREDRGDPQAIQVIESGRRLLGDTDECASSERDPLPELGDSPDERLGRLMVRH